MLSRTLRAAYGAARRDAQCVGNFDVNAREGWRCQLPQSLLSFKRGRGASLALKFSFHRDSSVVPVGTLPLGPSRRLRAVFRTSQGALNLDLRLQFAASTGWCSTKHGVRIEAIRLPDLLALLAVAIAKLPGM